MNRFERIESLRESAKELQGRANEVDAEFKTQYFALHNGVEDILNTWRTGIIDPVETARRIHSFMEE